MHLTFYHWSLTGDGSFKVLPHLGSLKESRADPTRSVELDQLIESLPINTLKNLGSELGPLIYMFMCVRVCVCVCVCIRDEICSQAVRWNKSFSTSGVYT